MDVVKVAHHGSANRDDALLAFTHAPVAVISVGADNDYGHPASSTLASLAKDGYRVYRTDLVGDVASEGDDGSVEVATMPVTPSCWGSQPKGVAPASVQAGTKDWLRALSSSASRAAATAGTRSRSGVVTARIWRCETGESESVATSSCLAAVEDDVGHQRDPEAGGDQPELRDVVLDLEGHRRPEAGPLREPDEVGPTARTAGDPVLGRKSARVAVPVWASGWFLGDARRTSSSSR